MRKLFCFVLIALMFSSNVFAQGTKEQATTSVATATDKKMSDITIAYVCSELSDEIFAMQVKAMQDYAKKIGVKFVYKACSTTGDKITACENYISAGVDTIIVHVNDGPAMESVMKEAQKAGVKFFAYDTNVEGADAYFGYDNYQMGYAIGKNAANWVKKTFSDKETVLAASCNYPSYNFLKIRENGYLAAMKDLCPNVQFVIQGEGGYTPKGVTSGENFLQSGKKLNLIVGINDAGCLGVYEAFKAANYGNDKVGIFGCDATNDALKAIAEKEIYRGTITTGLVAAAPQFIDIAVKLAQDKGGGNYTSPFIAITQDNIQDYL